MVHLMRRTILAGVILSVVAGCGPAQAPLTLSDLRHPDTLRCIRAIKWAGVNKMEAAIPDLVGQLENEDSAVRFYAIESLKTITGRDYGYRYQDQPAERHAAVQRWREAYDLSDVETEFTDGSAVEATG